MSRRWLFVLILLTLTGCGSCGKPQREMSRNEIDWALRSLPTLYITEGGEEFIQRADPDLPEAYLTPSGEIAWAAMVCTNPECPGTGTKKRPYIFILPTPGIVIGEAGVLERARPTSAEEAQAISDAGYQSCPACVNAGLAKPGGMQLDASGRVVIDLEGSANTVQRYELPEAAEERAYLYHQLELLDERTRYYHGEPGSDQ